MSVLLDRHSEIAVTPETAFYDEIAPLLSGGAKLGQVLGGWSRLPELGLDVASVLGRCGSDAPAASSFRALLELYAESCSKPYCSEKTPQHLRHVI